MVMVRKLSWVDGEWMVGAWVLWVIHVGESWFMRDFPMQIFPSLSENIFRTCTIKIIFVLNRCENPSVSVVLCWLYRYSWLYHGVPLIQSCLVRAEMPEQLCWSNHTISSPMMSKHFQKPKVAIVLVLSFGCGSLPIIPKMYEHPDSWTSLSMWTARGTRVIPAQNGLGHPSHPLLLFLGPISSAHNDASQPKPNLT